jgi:hypothetical protein
VIPLAHTIGGGSGPEIEFLMLAGAALVTAVILFVQKSSPPATPFVLLVIAIGLGVGAFAVNTAPSAGPTQLTIVDPRPGDEVKANKPVVLKMAVNNQPGGSHVHVFVDGGLESMPGGLTARVVLPRGTHEVLVELTSADHSSYNPRVTDKIELIAR